MPKITRTITRKQLYDKVWSTPMITLAKEFGLSDVGMAKLCRRHDIPRPPRGYWAKVEHEQKPRKAKLPNPEQDAAVEIHETEKKRLDPEIQAQIDVLREQLGLVPVRDNLRGAHQLVSEMRQHLEDCKVDDYGLYRMIDRRHARPALVPAKGSRRPVACLSGGVPEAGHPLQVRIIHGKGVKVLRKRMGLTQALFGKLVGVSVPTVVNWEAHSGKINLRKAAAGRLQEIRGLKKRDVAEMVGLGKAKTAKGKAGKAKKARPATSYWSGVGRWNAIDDCQAARWTMRGELLALCHKARASPKGTYIRRTLGATRWAYRECHR